LYGTLKCALRGHAIQQKHFRSRVHLKKEIEELTVETDSYKNSTIEAQSKLEEKQK
jgi:hypothetical protein